MKNGKIINEDGITYYKDDELHREDGPAVEWPGGSEFWYMNGEKHREDGPAIKWYNGDKWWYLNDVRYSEEDYKFELRKIKLQKI